MNEIKLSIDDEKLETVLTLLNSLKDGLIEKIEINSKTSNMRRTTQYQPKTNTIIREENSGTNDSSGKYASVVAYKDRIKHRKKRVI